MSPRSIEIGSRVRSGARSGARAWALAAAALCGSAGAAPAVVGGTPAAGPLAEASVMVLSSKGGVCSGLALAADVVLTAGHCADGRAKNLRVYPAGGSELLAVAAIAVHPLYRADAPETRRPSVDLALLRLGEPVPSSGRAVLGADQPSRGAPLRVGGFGVAREGDGRSTGTFREAALTTVEPYGRGKILLWAAPTAGAKAGACQGDSGGPIVDAGGTVVAISSWAAAGLKAEKGCGGISQGILTGPQRGWIDQTLAGWGRSANWR